MIDCNGSQLILPTISSNKLRLGFLHLALQLLSHKHTMVKTINTFLHQIILLLSKSDKNLLTFRKYIGFKHGVLEQVFFRMILSKPARFSPIYETSLKLVEVFV